MISLFPASTMRCLSAWFRASACLFTSRVTSATILSSSRRTSCGRPSQNLVLVSRT
ncbi:hypothetical protein D3C72_2092580 [compost metagenome]